MPDAPASAAERLERLPLSPYHRLIFVIIALAFFFDSMDLAMMTFLLGSIKAEFGLCLLYTSPSPRDRQKSRMPSSA